MPVPTRKRLRRSKSLVNEINVELHKKIRVRDTSFVSRTRLESTRYSPRKIVVLRAITINPNTEPHMLEQILVEHRLLGEQIWQDRNLLRKTLHICNKLIDV